MPAVLAAMMQGNKMQTFCSTYSQIANSGADTKLFLNLMIQFYLNNVTNVHQLTSHSALSCPTIWRLYRDHRLLWRHFGLWYNRPDVCGARPDVTWRHHRKAELSELWITWRPRCHVSPECCIFSVKYLISAHAEGSRGGRVFDAACLFIHPVSQEPMQLGSPNVT